MLYNIVIEARDEPCASCGQALDDPIDGLGGMNANGTGTVRRSRAGTRPLCMLERADRIACGSADPRPCLACQSEGPLGRRPPHQAELAGAMVANEEADGRWPTTFDAIPFSTIVGQESSQLDQTEFQNTGVYNTFEDMLQAQGHRVTVSFLLCTLLCDTLGPPSGATLSALAH